MLTWSPAVMEEIRERNKCFNEATPLLTWSPYAVAFKTMLDGCFNEATPLLTWSPTGSEAALTKGATFQ